MEDIINKYIRIPEPTYLRGGINNQGTTDPFNCLLQALFNIPAIRMAIYHLPIITDDYQFNPDITLELQFMFYTMQYTDFTTSTTKLFKLLNIINVFNVYSFSEIVSFLINVLV